MSLDAGFCRHKHYTCSHSFTNAIFKMHDFCPSLLIPIWIRDRRVGWKWALWGYIADTVDDSTHLLGEKFPSLALLNAWVIASFTKHLKKVLRNKINCISLFFRIKDVLLNIFNVSCKTKRFEVNIIHLSLPPLDLLPWIKARYTWQGFHEKVKKLYGKLMSIIDYNFAHKLGNWKQRSTLTGSCWM